MKVNTYIRFEKTFITMQLTAALKNTIIRAQKAEITEYYIYRNLAGIIKNTNNADVLLKIGNDELRHYKFWEGITNTPIKPNKFKIWWFTFISRFLGLSFGIRLMELGEQGAQSDYLKVVEQIPDASFIIDEENEHEHQLIEMLESKSLSYIGSIVLGLNDALVELTGALAGLTFALQNTQLTAIAGLITGIAASFSMAASEYLSNKAEGNTKEAISSSVYTGVAYIITVILLVLPYFIFTNYIVCLALTLSIALLIILIFNFYISVARGYSFKKRFLEMAIISMGVAALSFAIGYVVRKTIGIEV